MYYFNALFLLVITLCKFNDVIRIRKRRIDDKYNDHKKKDNQWLTKRYTEGFDNRNPYKCGGEI